MWDRLDKSNLHEYLDHLLRLSLEDRHLRFAGFVSDVSIEEYVNKINMKNDVIVVYREKLDEIIGACHLGFLNNNHVEIGISVERDQRGKGIGSKLLERGMLIARMRGAKKISLICLSSNKWMIKKVTEYNMSKHYESNECEAYGLVSLPSTSEYGNMREQYTDELITTQRSFWKTMAGVLKNSARQIYGIHV